MEATKKEIYIFVSCLVRSGQVGVESSQTQDTPDAEEADDGHQQTRRRLLDRLQEGLVLPRNWSTFVHGLVRLFID